MSSYPGLSATDLTTKEAGSNTAMMAFNRLMFRAFPFSRQSADNGALPTLFAATAPNAKGGVLYGPGGFMELRGYPKITRINPQAKDLRLAKQLWSVSEQLTGITYS